MYQPLWVRSLLAMTLLALGLSTSAIGATGKDMSAYVLGPGDTIRVQVYGEPDLSIETQVSDTGLLSYPFLGEIRLRGMTVGQLERYITNGLSGDYLVDPKVTVSILSYRNFYVNGEVARPGGFPFQPGLTVRKAISLAGGFTERASRNEIYVVPETDANARPRKVNLNALVKPGDIITIEQSFF
ncbi:MAG: polysaccharide biosynthesis/export family protein [Pseudomonadota bacterium]|nr:polysaccharide biosynthesis/export family protein [Pseudomonadota bacterium]